jgi:hypothetical protein
MQNNTWMATHTSGHTNPVQVTPPHFLSLPPMSLYVSLLRLLLLLSVFAFIFFHSPSSSSSSFRYSILVRHAVMQTCLRTRQKCWSRNWAHNIGEHPSTIPDSHDGTEHRTSTEKFAGSAKSRKRTANKSTTIHHSTQISALMEMDVNVIHCYFYTYMFSRTPPTLS